jgi:hypothetical protein
VLVPGLLAGLALIGFLAHSISLTTAFTAVSMCGVQV